MSCALWTGLDERNAHHIGLPAPTSCANRFKLRYSWRMLARGIRRDRQVQRVRCESLIGLETCVPVFARRGAKVAWPRVWSALVGDSRGSCDARTTNPVSQASQVRTAPDVHHSWPSRARMRIRANS